MVVDSVSGVITLKPEQIKPAPSMGSVLDTDCLIGLGTIDERMLILVDIDYLMTSTGMRLIKRLVAQNNNRTIVFNKELENIK